MTVAVMVVAIIADLVAMIYVGLKFEGVSDVRPPEPDATRARREVKGD